MEFFVAIFHKLRNSQKVQQGNEFKRERSQGAARAVQIEDLLCGCACLCGCAYLRAMVIWDRNWKGGRGWGERGKGLMAVAASNEFINTKDEDEEKWQTKARMPD